ncbi:MAG: NifB/NifX family molybdenum-iron cluster-binding protein [Candidatus Brocadiia bacterium]
MKVAIPVFGTRVSPRFDCGPVLLLAEVDDGEVTASRYVADAAEDPLRRIARLRELGVEAVVCGAITGFLLRHLAANGIRVFPWIFAEAGEALAALARGELVPRAVGGVGRGRGRGAGGRGRRGPRWPR